MMSTVINPEREIWELNRVKWETRAAIAVVFGTLGTGLVWALNNAPNWLAKPKVPEVLITPLPADPPTEAIEEHFEIPKLQPRDVEPETKWVHPIFVPPDPDAPPPIFYPVSSQSTATADAATLPTLKTVSLKKPKNGFQKFGDGASNVWDAIVRLPALTAYHSFKNKFCR